MSEVFVVLNGAHIGLFSDPSSQLVIPRLTGFQVSRGYMGTTVQFVGDTYPTAFRGESKTRTYDLTARYMSDEQDQMVALLDLFDTAAAAPDSRLLLRTHVGQASGFDQSEAVQVFDVKATPGFGQYVDVSFTATVVQFTFAV